MSAVPLPPIDDNLPELALALDAAMQAGDAIMKVYATEFETKTKGDDSPITEADLASNKIIKEVLKKSGHYILSEEDKDDKARLNEQKLWIVDPLDGTSDFVGRTGEFTVMIALVVDKKSVLGVINWPVEKTVFLAQAGFGAFRHTGTWERISVSKTFDLNQCRAVGSRNHLSDAEKALIEKLGIAEFTSIGSSLKVGKISSGEADVYLTTTNKMKEWDTCASNCIVSEAGGLMTDMLGNEMQYNNEMVNHQNGILVTNKLVHNAIVSEYSKSKTN